jgi:hypothetical protein
MKKKKKNNLHLMNSINLDNIMLIQTMLICTKQMVHIIHLLIIMKDNYQFPFSLPHSGQIGYNIINKKLTELN